MPRGFRSNCLAGSKPFHLIEVEHHHDVREAFEPLQAARILRIEMDFGHDLRPVAL
jgi:hypothetical protein